MAKSTTDKLADRLARNGSTSVTLSDPDDRYEYDRVRNALRRAAIKCGNNYSTEKRGRKVTAYIF